MLQEYFFPAFMKEIKDDLTREGEQEIIKACCQKLRTQLNKAPSLTAGKPNKILSMVLEDTKLGIAFVDESGKALFTFQINVSND
jgi:transcriptional accessory protein Tex/SPT6